jgi:tricarballylate dehydrogenase
MMASIDLAGERPDVLVVGAGNAALSAAISASENGAKVLMLEAAPYEERGGNSHFTGGAFRFAFRGVDDLVSVLPALADENLENVDFGTYTEEQYFDDLFALTQYRTDPELAEILVRGSLETARWVARQGVKLQPGLGRQAYQVDGKFKFWGGLALHIWGGGPEMLKALYASAERRGIAISFETPAVALMREDGRVTGVVAERGGKRVEVKAGAVVLACGSFESNPEMRARYLGPGWELARVRGTRFNMGVGLRMALDIGARPHGHWSGCHSVAWGRQRAAVRRPDRRRPVPEAQLSVRHHRQREGRALPRRGRQLPQPHLREVRRRDRQAAGHVRLAGVRRQGEPPAARRVPHPPRHQGRGRHAGGACRKARRRRRGGVPAHGR